MTDTFICPLCGSDEVRHEMVNATPIWICDPCPFIGFEFVHSIDAKNVLDRLTKQGVDSDSVQVST